MCQQWETLSFWKTHWYSHCFPNMLLTSLQSYFSLTAWKMYRVDDNKSKKCQILLGLHGRLVIIQGSPQASGFWWSCIHLNTKWIFEVCLEEMQSSISRYDPGPAQSLFKLNGSWSVQMGFMGGEHHISHANFWKFTGKIVHKLGWQNQSSY